jgi:putative SOS response-associated peptidase YedK
MVVILEDDDYKEWLSATAEDTHNFLHQFPAESMKVTS